MSDREDEIDRLLKSLIKTDNPVKGSLNELFWQKINTMRISSNAAVKMLKMDIRSLTGIINGTKKSVDYTNIIKLASFLQLPKEQVVQLYIEALEKNFNTLIPRSSAKKIEFIKENFDLAVLKKAGFINSITDFEEIEKKLVTFLGLRSIEDYKKPQLEAAFSSGAVKPKNELTRALWIYSAELAFQEIDNPFPYDKQALIEYFPKIGWHSINVEYGLINVIRDLFKLGVTVIYQAPLPTLHLRGATFSVDDRPSIVLTNYVGYYPTLWFALIHELFHVLFDFEEIKKHEYHLSDDDIDQLSVIEKEKEANNFARQYLFPREKTDEVRKYINEQNTQFISDYAITNHIHPSFIYVFNATDVGKSDRMAWARAKRYNPPEMKNLISPLDNAWSNAVPVKDFFNSIKFKLYN